MTRAKSTQTFTCKWPELTLTGEVTESFLFFVLMTRTMYQLFCKSRSPQIDLARLIWDIGWLR